MIGGDDQIYAFIMPEPGEPGSKKRSGKRANQFGKQLTEQVVMRSFTHANFSSNDYEPFVGEECIPSKMERGTCTPFISQEEFESINEDYPNKLAGIFIHNEPAIDDLLVDVSIGGKGNFAHRTSLHLPYSGIYRILSSQFENKTHKLKFWN